MKIKWPKCPKCRKQNVELIEHWTASISWDPTDSREANEGALMPGDPFKVEGHCIDCEYHWTIRGAIQVNPKWFEDEP